MNAKGIIYLSIALLTFAFTHITDKIGIDSGVDPAVFSFFRIFIALILIAIIWLFVRKNGLVKFNKRYIKNLIILGFIASGLVVLLTVSALMHTTATNKGTHTRDKRHALTLSTG